MQLSLKYDLPFTTVTIAYRGVTLEIPDILVDTGSANSARSFIRDNFLVRGRIWAQLKYWKGHEIVSKEKEFENWFNAIARWIRKHYQKISELEYIGLHALEWKKRGGMLKDVLYKSAK